MVSKLEYKKNYIVLLASRLKKIKTYLAITLVIISKLFAITLSIFISIHEQFAHFLYPEIG